MMKEIRNPAGTKLDWAFEYEEVAGIKFKTDPYNRVIRKRINSYYTKEPNTLKWLDKMQPNETLVDIGANIGVYSLYAAKKGVNVKAFEPHAQNFSELNTNIWLNDLDQYVRAYPVALLDKPFSPTYSVLSILSPVPGQSHNNVGTHGEFKQGTVVYDLDSFDFEPDYIKLDVDGLEDLVIKGMINTLNSVKSILIEVTNKDTLKPLLDLGYEIDDSMTYKLSETETNYVCNSRNIK